jgi:molybdopterin molybdotransferase
MKPAMLSYDEALSQVLRAAAAVPGTERLPTIEVGGRVLAEDLRSTLDVPGMDNSQMDGYAVRVADVEADRPLRVSQRIAAGAVGSPLEPGTVARIFTGAMVPAGADAVVMQEQARVDGDQVLITARPSTGEWIRRTGEDIRAGSVVLARGARLSPQATGLAASIGAASLLVHRRVRVACFFTGDELAMPGEPLKPGAIYNSNRFMLVALLRRMGCEVRDLGIVPDSLAATKDALRDAAAGNDLIVTSGGMSVGEEDHVKPAVEAEGQLSMWSVAIKPGKPLAYGSVRRAGGAPASGPDADATGAGAAHFIGLPGNPVSAFVTFLLFVRPFVLRLQGIDDVAPRRYALRADFDWPRPDRRREFLRARINESGGLDLFPNQGSAVLTSTVWAHGLVDNPPSTAVSRGQVVSFLPFEDLLG